MFFDNTLLLSNAQAITSTAPSTNIYDVTGAGSGVAPSLVFGQGVTNFGADIGIGDGVAVPTAYFTVTTAFVSGGGATLSIQVQSAPASSNSPGSYVTLSQTQVFTAAQLVAGATIILPIPPVAPIEAAEALPRFYRFNYVVATSTFSAGNITGGILLNPAIGIPSTFYPNNFTAA